MSELCFLYKQGRKLRLDRDRNSFPCEFLYGIEQLRDQGLDVAFLEDTDLGISPPKTLVRCFITRLSIFLGGLPVGMLAALLLKKNRTVLRQHGLLLATTNGIGLALGMASMIGLINNRVAILAMGILPHDASFWEKKCLTAVLKRLEIIVISRAEQQYLAKLLPQKTIYYVPFGVDTIFWHKFLIASTPAKPYVLAIGNDRNRDWETLIESWDEELPNLKIITSKRINTLKANIEVISGDWSTAKLSDCQIRNFYSGALMVVIPLLQTIQPAGQSVCLQSMAMEIPVVMTKIKGIWDSSIMVDGQNIKFIAPNDPEALRAGVREMIFDKDLRSRLSKNGKQTVLEHYNENVMAIGISDTISKIAKEL